MRIVVALGGNALLRRGEKPDAKTQIENVRRAVEAMAPLAEKHELVITHGNGPQIGVIALESANNEDLTEPYPFDTLGAETQGMIGYWLLQALQNALPGRSVGSMVNQTLVLAGDPAFENPTKFIGVTYDKETSEKVAAERGWIMKADGEYFRRVVGSPKPQRVVETGLIRRMLDAGAVVVCAGGGGIPVVRNSEGKLEGVEAVIDKDLTAAKLAEHLEADMLIILTDVDSVKIDFGKPTEKAIGHTSPAELRELDFPAGSMGPKIEAASNFVELTGATAAIGELSRIQDIVAGTSGTILTASGKYKAPVSE